MAHRRSSSATPVDADKRVVELREQNDDVTEKAEAREEMPLQAAIKYRICMLLREILWSTSSLAVS
jgi:hypothetical protein